MNNIFYIVATMFSLQRYLCYCPFSNSNIPGDFERRLSTGYLEKAEWNNTLEFIPPINSGKVIKVYDGDTITIASKLPYYSSPVYRFSVRLRGIDSPEINGKTFTEKELALNSKICLSNLVMGKMVQLHNVSTEKYGRILADVYCENIHLNQWMLDHKLAVPYDGGTKYRPLEWDVNGVEDENSSCDD